MGGVCDRGGRKSILGAPLPGNVFRVYRDAGCHWLEGQPLYDGTGTGFIYLPQCALLCVPLSFMSFYWGGVVWRILNIGVFAVGVWRFTRLAGRNESPGMFARVSLIVALLSWSAARHGQMTLMMGGLMLVAVVELVDRRWWRAVLWMTLGFALKPLIVVLMLLAAVLYPRTSWRMLLAMVALVALPLLAQRPEYVLEQYRQSVQMLNDASHWGPSKQFPHLFWVLHAAGVEIPRGRPDRVAAAGGRAHPGILLGGPAEVQGCPGRRAVVYDGGDLSVVVQSSHGTQRLLPVGRGGGHLHGPSGGRAELACRGGPDRHRDGDAGELSVGPLRADRVAEAAGVRPVPGDRVGAVLAGM